jgi:hypothetical protein
MYALIARKARGTPHRAAPAVLNADSGEKLTSSPP